MRTKTIGAAVAALAIVGLIPALAAQATPEPKTPACHATGSESNPWELIELPDAALEAHAAHGDIIPAPAEGCPAPVVDPPDEEEPPTEPVQTFTLIAWEMPSWIDATTPSWPQSYETSVVQTVADLDALDPLLPCGSQFQLDLNYTGSIVDALIAGGVLYGPGNPPEALIPGGWGVAYKLVQTTACETHEPVIEQHATGACNSTAIWVDHTWTTTDGVVSDDLYTPRDLDRAEAISLGCYVPPVVDCAEGTVPGWLNEFGDPTSCVNDDPCPETDEPGCPTNEPTLPPAPPTDLGDALAYTGVEGVPLILGGAAAILLLGAASIFFTSRRAGGGL